MLNNYETIKALVVDHQRELERAAATRRTTHRLRRWRLGRRTATTATSTTTTSPNKAPRPAVSWH